MSTEEITKRRVTMTSVQALPPGEDGEARVLTTECIDYVRPDFLDAYLAAVRPNWQSVIVSDEPDAGPGGYHGQTVVPEILDHPLAGQVFAATKEG